MTEPKDQIQYGFRIDSLQINTKQVYERLQEYDGDWEKVFNYFEERLDEHRKRQGLKRWYIAECRVCPEVKQHFRDIERRDRWAREHSRWDVNPRFFPDTELKKHNVKIYEEWK